MPAFIAAWLIGLAPVLTATAFQLLTSLGIGIATFTGVSLMVTQLHSFAANYWGALPTAVLQLVGLMRIDQALNLMLSTLTAKFTLTGMLNGSFKRLVVR